MWVSGQHHVPAPLPPGMRPRYQFYRRLGGHRGGENVASIGIRSPESPARIELLYTLHYPVPHILKMYFAVLQTWRDKAELVYARHYSD